MGWLLCTLTTSVCSIFSVWTFVLNSKRSSTSKIVLTLVYDESMVPASSLAMSDWLTPAALASSDCFRPSWRLRLPMSSSVGNMV